MLVGGALFAGEFGGVTDFSCGAVSILSAAIAAFSGITDLSVVALAIGGAGFTLVVDADLSVGTFGVVATFALCACALETDKPGGTVVVVETACASILSADLAVLAIGVFEAAFAGAGGDIAFLVVCAIGVFSATCATFSVFADLAGAALCVVGASAAVVVDTDESARAIFVVSAVSAFASAADTERALGAIAVVVAAFADVFFADFTVFAVFVFFTITVFAGPSGADFTSATSGIIAASDTAASIADLAVFAIFVFDAVAAEVGGGVANTGGALFVFEADHTSVGGGVAELAVFAVFVGAAAFHAFAFFADPPGTALGVVVARGAFVVFANLAFGADAIRAVTVAFFACTADADMALIALLVSLTREASSVCAGGTVLAVCVIFTSRALANAVETGSALALGVTFASACADIVSAKADGAIFVFATISIADASAVAPCGGCKRKGEPTAGDPHKKCTLFHDLSSLR